ncbi:MAG: alkaline phosphatase family protein [Bacteroidaceae bacterium]|nr:alkaline phosphatase family protein [Bacteroidaceae bacterium]
MISKTRFLTPLIAMLAAMSVDAETAPELQRIVVNIVVDQLRTDYMEAFAPLYGEGGFKRLMAEARYYTDATMPFRRPDRASAAASLSTGATPFVNGIPALSWLSRQTLQPVFCVDDARHKGQRTDERTSAAGILTTTVADELELATARRAIVLSIAAERDVAVLLAGHLADGVFWLNDKTGDWCGTSYYGEFPGWVSAFDRMSPLGSRLKDIVWQPVYDGAYASFHYFHSNAEAASNAVFEHRFKGDRRMREFKTSAMANDEVARLVERTMDATPIGRDETPDLLCIALYAGAPEGNSVVTAPAEVQDTYVRLDSTLARVINKVEQTVGRGRALFVVTSTGYADTDALSFRYEQLGLETSTFSMERAALLTNMYLSALFGQAQYVTASHGTQIYLDAKLIEQRQLRMADVLARAEEFLVQMSGVRNIYTATELVRASEEPAPGGSHVGIAAVRNAWSASRSGDILVDVMPGWRVECHNGKTYVDPGLAHAAFPLFFLGPDVKSQRITQPISATRIAPTIAASMRIRAPSGSTERAIPLAD